MLEPSDQSVEISPESSSELEVRKKDDEMKNAVTNAFIYCKSLLETENLLTNTPPTIISDISIAMGKEIFKEIKFMLEDRKIIIDEDLIFADDITVDNWKEYERCKDEYISKESAEFMPEELQSFRDYEFIPFEYKEKAVALAEMHPKWSIKTLQRKSCSRLKSKKMLRVWKEDMMRCGTVIDKWNYIETQNFQEARESLEQVTTRTLQQWVMTIAFPLLTEEFKFSASLRWVNRFKQKYNIRQRKITRFISSKELASMDEILEAAERFQMQMKEIISDFDFVINTDQTGCQYQIPYNRSLAPQGSKSVLVRKKSLHDITHSYTAQFTLIASGKLLPVVFLCLQESTGKFGPIIKTKIDTLMSDYKNVCYMLKIGEINKANIYKLFEILFVSLRRKKNF